MKNNLFKTDKKIEKAFLVGVAINKIHHSFDDELEELASLCHTAGLEVVGQTYQNIKEETPATLLGSGKVEEIKNFVEQLSANVVVVDCELTGSQINNISEIVGVKVIDRSILILDIFAGRATSNEGRLQVKLAQFKYTLPRISSASRGSDKFGSGGVGMRGPGETKLETDKRTIRDNICKLEAEILKLRNQRKVQKSERKKNQLKQVAIVGYTNAGKSTLMNTITKAGIFADDLLFATLDTTSRVLWLGDSKRVLLVDTVGFINKLPHSFIQAFNATLEETADADLLVHVVDISDKNYMEKSQVVNDVLKQIHADNIPMIVVYNKIDKLTKPFEVPKDAILISAKNNAGIEKLKSEIDKKLFN
ncbi:MAG: GTPase HflX [Clostridia bacterium]|nr:GTPase HflX [Clostridia bacterium]